MIEKNARANGVEGFSIPTAAEFAATGRKRIEEFVDAQTELLDELQETIGNGLSGCNRRLIWRPNLLPN
jgi:hypothetical protein